MTTKPKASLYRLKPGGPLAAGVDADAIARAAEAAEAAPPPMDGNAALKQNKRKQNQSKPKSESPDPSPEADKADAGTGVKVTRDKRRKSKPKTAEITATYGPTESPKSNKGGKSGEVSSAQEVKAENTVEAIKREGLTGRQLRMARRVALKHNLEPTSDFDAVRLLRAKGIDPFSRANVLELVPTDQGDEAGQSQANLPATVSPAAPPPAIPDPQKPKPKPEDLAAENRASEIFKIQKDITRRRRKKMVMLFARLGVFVILPTLLAGLYFTLIATPMYATKSEFVIQQADAPAAGMGGLFAGTGLAVQQDSTTVQSYLQSRDAMRRLNEDQGFRDHFSQDYIDRLQRLEPNASNEDTYKLYEKNVKVGFDPTEGILKMEVVAASPEASEAFSRALIGYAEEQVDNLTQRLRKDQMAGALTNFADSERKVQEAQLRVLDLQERLGVLDPVSETGSLMQQITQFEVQLRTKQLELQQIQSAAQPSQGRVRAIQGEIGRLQTLVAQLRSSMTEGQDGTVSLARVSGELRIAEADLATRQLLLQQAAQQLETARIEANRQVRYMAVGVTPVAPDEPTYPRAFENTLLAFVIFLGIYLMISLTTAVLREQVSA